MSFIKNLFEKRKDKKYGKGHKLGDGSTPSTSSQYQPEQHAAYRPPSSANQSEASRMAGEAALARMTNSKISLQVLFDSYFANSFHKQIH